MASNNKVAVTTTIEERAGMYMAIDDEVATPTTPEMGKGHTSVDEEKHPPSLSMSHGQIDGTTDTGDELRNTKKSTHSVEPAFLGKHGASSPRQSRMVKRPKTGAIEIPEQGGASYAGDDDTEDEEGRVEVDNEVLGGGKKKAAPALKIPSTRLKFDHPGFLRPKIPRNGHRDQDNALLPPQQRWAPPGAYRNRGLQKTPDAPGLKTSDLTSNKTLMGQKSHVRKEYHLAEQPTTPGFTGDIQHLKENDTQIADAGADHGSDGVVVHRSEWELEIENAKLRAKVEDLNADKKAQRVVTASALRDLSASEEALAEASRAAPNVDRILEEHAEQEKRISSLEKENTEYKAEIKRLKQEAASDRQIIRTNKIKIMKLEKKTKNRKTAIEDRRQLMETNMKLEVALHGSQQALAAEKHLAQHYRA